MTSIESILLKALIVVLVSSCAEPLVLSAAPSGIAASEDQTLRPVPNASTRCAPGELLVKWKEGPDSPAATLGNAQIGSTVQRNFHEIGWQQVKLPCELSLQEAIARYRALGSVSAVEPNYAIAPILPPRRDAIDPAAGVGNTGVPPSVEDGAPGITDQLPTSHSALRTEKSADSAPTPIIPNDPNFSAQWDLTIIGMPNAWAITTGSSNVVVAILDTGVDYNHEDLAANMWRNPGETGLDANGNDKATNGIDDDGDGYVDDVYGINTFDHNSDPMDLGFYSGGNNYHGTKCAGVIGAKGNNGKGVAGINWSVQIMALRFFGGDQSIGNVHEWTGDVLEAFNYLIQQRRRGVNIRVTNNSYYDWANQASTLAVSDAINIAGTEGILTVCVAGNDGISTDSFPIWPADFDSPYVISVASSDSNDLMPSYSNYGRSTVDLAAPSADDNRNVAITTTSKGSEYVSNFGGTSAACAHVTGAAALLWSVKPDATPLEIKRALMQSVDQKASFRGRVVSNGRLNVASALQVITNASLPPVILGAFPASSRVGQDAVIEVWFSAPMNRASVEAALQITPAVSGTADWSDGDRLLRLRPSVPLARTNYTARILGTAHDRAGQTLDGDFNRTSGGSPADDYVWDFRFAPLNDDFADALTLTGTIGSLKGHTADTSYEVDEPLAKGYPFYPLSLWYRWVADRDGWMTFDTSTPDGLDTIAAAYTGSTLASLVQAAFNDNFGATRGGRISFPVIAGTNYSITVAGHLDIATGSLSDGMGAFTLAWYPTPPPDFTGAGFSPAQGADGSQTILTGTNFTGATAVLFNGVNASFTNALGNNADLKIIAIVPPGASTGPITVQTPHGDVTTSSSFVISAPSLTIEAFGPNGLLIQWQETGATLEVADSLGAGASWLKATNAVTVDPNGGFSVVLATANGPKFYRLRKP